ncbi:MAG: TRAP transporter large permease [bacterium]
MSITAAAVISSLLLILGAPLFLVIGAFSSLCMLGEGYPLAMMAQQMFSITEKEALLAIPFFVTAATLMTKGESAGRIMDFINSLIDWLPGGLALASIASCIFFAALSGLSPTAIIAVGALACPALVRSRYPERFSIGLLTSAGSLGILVPPSIVVIIFGIMGEVNIQHLFLAALTPILIIAAMFSAFSVALSIRLRIARNPFSPKRVLDSLRKGVLALLSTGIIAGIYLGWFSVTQASALIAAYALAIELLAYRKVRLRHLPELFRRSATVTGMILVIISVAMSFNWFLTVQGVPFRVSGFITDHVSSPIAFLALVNLFLLALGCIMDILSAIFITVPLLLPAAVAMGIDPVHFGIVFIVNFEIGYLTPPIGINLFTSSAVFRRSLLDVAGSVLPFLGLLLAALVLVTYFPSLSLWTLNGI